MRSGSQTHDSQIVSKHSAVNWLAGVIVNLDQGILPKNQSLQNQSGVLGWRLSNVSKVSKVPTLTPKAVKKVS